MESSFWFDTIILGWSIGILSGQSTSCGYSFSYLDHKVHFGNDNFDSFFICFTQAEPAPVVSVLEGRHIIDDHHKYDVIYDIISEKKLLGFKNVYNKKNIQDFVTHEIYIFHFSH